MSISSGTLVCMRKAISYCAMRVAISGFVSTASRMRFRLLTAVMTSCCRGRSTPGGLLDVVHRVARRVELHALEPAGQEAAVPLPRRDRLRRTRAGAARQHDEAGQVVALGAQAVDDPRAHAGPAGDRRARVHERVGRVVVDLLGLHRADDADVVGDAADVREEVADRLPRLAELG